MRGGLSVIVGGRASSEREPSAVEAVASSDSPGSASRSEEARQLTFDGREVLVADSLGPRLTERQREILRAVRLAGSMRTAEIGRLAHDLRGSCASDGARWGSWSSKPTAARVGCCPYAVVDGGSYANRLLKRGFLRRVGRGRWSLPDHD